MKLTTTQLQRIIQEELEEAEAILSKTPPTT